MKPEVTVKPTGNQGAWGIVKSRRMTLKQAVAIDEALQELRELKARQGSQIRKAAK